MNPLRHYVRARLHRRLFVWFGWTILATGVLVGSLMSLTGGRAHWRREEQRMKAFVGGRFAEVWDDPARRDALAAAAARDLDVDIVLRDNRRNVLVSFGSACGFGEYALGVPVEKDGAIVGRVLICAPRHRMFSWWRIVLGLALAGAVLWLASARIARRIAHPLHELALVAQKLGAGRLSARAKLARHQPGEVGMLAESINEMAARIEKQLADQRELLAAVSHELRTPLARIRILVELARESGASEKIVQELEREVVEIDGLAGELLAGARMDFSALAPQALDAADVARRALERAGADPALLVVETGNTSFQADPTLIARALANLVDNAQRHGGGLKALRIKGAEGSVTFAVEDAGPGFAPGEEEHAFEAFRRRAPAAGQDRGSLGLGLALVKRIAQAHGGTAFAANRPGGGAQVGIEIRSLSVGT